MKRLQKFLPPDQKPGVVHAGNSLEFTRAFEVFCWHHDKSTPYRSETHGKSRKRSSQGQRRYLCTSASVRSCRKAVGEAVDCFCYLRNIQDKLADGRSPYERRKVVFINLCKMIRGIHIGYAQNFGGGWTRDSIIADWHDIAKEVGIENCKKYFSLRRWFPETRWSRTTANPTPPESREIRRGERRRGVTHCDAQVVTHCKKNAELQACLKLIATLWKQGEISGVCRGDSCIAMLCPENKCVKIHWRREANKNQFGQNG